MPTNSRKSAGNRRITPRRKRSEQFVLDVRLRSKKETRLRQRRLAMWIVKGVCALAVVGGVYWSVLRVTGLLLYDNPNYRLDHLEIETDGSLTRAEVLQEAKLHQGMNLLSIDIETVRQRLESLPQVRWTRVTRVLPDRLVVEILERKPIAWLVCPELGIRSHTSRGGFLLDAQGTVMACQSLLREYMTLPRIIVRGLPRLKVGSVLETNMLGEALYLYEESIPYLSHHHLAIAEIDLNKDYGFTVRYNDGSEVFFGLGSLDEQMRRHDWILADCEAREMAVAKLNLMVKKNVPIVYQDSPGARVPRRVVPVSAPAAPSGSGLDSHREDLNIILRR